VREGVTRALQLDHPVLIVAHGGVFWALQRMLGFAEVSHIANAVLAHFQPPQGGGESWRIKLV
jgi:broad specificity phosphatase PhoE